MRVAQCVFFVPLPEFGVIGDDSQFAAGGEHPVKVPQAFILNHSPFVVSRLGPWIAEVEVNDARDRIGQPEAKEFGRIGVQESYV